MNTRLMNLMLIFALALGITFGLLHASAATASSSPFSGEETGSSESDPAARPAAEEATLPISREPAAQILVGAVAILFGMLALLPLFAGNAERI